MLVDQLAPDTNLQPLPPVVIVCLSIRHGGVDVRVRQTALALAARGVDHRVVVIRDSVLHHSLAAAGVATHPLDRGRGDPRIVRDILRLARQMGARIIDAHNTQSQYWAVAAAMLGRIPGRIATTHSVYSEDHPGALRQRFHESALVLARLAGFRFLAVSRSVENYLLGPMRVAPDRVTLSRNGMEPLGRDPAPIDVQAEAGWPADALVLTMIGRLDPRKGHRFAIEALRQIVKAGERRARLFIAGSGREEQVLRDLVAQTGMADYVHFAGFRSDVPEILARTDLFLLPSLSEGLPYTVLEAARQGVPTLGSRLEGTEDVLTDGETTFFVPAGDVDALRQSLQALIDDPDRLRSVGAAARRHLETSMGVERMFGETFETYRRALATGN